MSSFTYPRVFPRKAEIVAVEPLEPGGSLPIPRLLSVPNVTLEVLDCETPCEGDLDGSGDVSVDDLLAVLAAYGTSDPDADLDGNGTVDVNDVLIVIAAWGDC